MNFDSSIDLNVLASELFKDGEVWSSRDKLLYPAMNELSKLHGYNIMKNKNTICCNHHGKPSTTRNYVEGDLKCNCPFMVKMKPLSKMGYKSNPTSSNWAHHLHWDVPVIITMAICEHGKNCDPGK